CPAAWPSAPTSSPYRSAAAGTPGRARPGVPRRPRHPSGVAAAGARPADAGGEAFRGDQPVAVLDELGDLAPVLVGREPGAHPALVADVRGDEEAVGVGCDEGLLHARAGLEHHRPAVLGGDEEELVPDPERGRAVPAERLLDGLR